MDSEVRPSPSVDGQITKQVYRNSRSLGFLSVLGDEGTYLETGRLTKVATQVSALRLPCAHLLPHGVEKKALPSHLHMPLHNRGCGSTARRVKPVKPCETHPETAQQACETVEAVGKLQRVKGYLTSLLMLLGRLHRFHTPAVRFQDGFHMASQVSHARPCNAALGLHELAQLP